MSPSVSQDNENNFLSEKHSVLSLLFLSYKYLQCFSLAVFPVFSAQVHRSETVSLPSPATSPTPPTVCSGGTSPNSTCLRSATVRRLLTSFLHFVLSGSQTFTHWWFQTSFRLCRKLCPRVSEHENTSRSRKVFLTESHFNCGGCL